MPDKSKKRRAAALKYDPDKDSAPVLSAGGKGVIAEKIIEKAIGHDIPIRHNPPLAELLTAVPLGCEIPDDLYEAVAEILMQIIALDSKKSS
ncbi:EscU/YscU/HrcU family type III secretion system export apparatus switch protein [bacterium]|nr:EscU/YscU/HrcU family type III secretion system export apparatus switch protein [bacterium]MBU1024475.1 EscU/YscU/HrcU family type III secretion system export apparatus switch protein [bacterium]